MKMTQTLAELQPFIQMNRRLATMVFRAQMVEGAEYVRLELTSGDTIQTSRHICIIPNPEIAECTERLLNAKLLEATSEIIAENEQRIRRHLDLALRRSVA